jgi:polysaccharide pyruvyl transferase WcaK-like protein
VGRGFDVRLFPMQLKGAASDDRPFLAELCSGISSSRIEIMGDYNNMKDHMAAISKCNYFIGHKTHSIVMSLAMAVPLIAIAYHPKTLDFMQKFGLAEYCIDDRRLEFGNFKTMFERLEDNREEVVRLQKAKVKVFAKTVQSDFDDMLKSYL